MNDDEHEEGKAIMGVVFIVGVLVGCLVSLVIL
jgi:hypothetical protein